jgi:transcription-repair coupling factor (superfamily II helicase)
MYIPESYVDDENTRLEIYQRLSGVKSFEELVSIKDELVDRFGRLPDEVESLTKHIEIKIMLAEKGFEKIIISGETVELFLDVNNDEIFQSGYFEKAVNYINSNLSNKAKLKQTKKSLSIQFRLSLYDNPELKLGEIYSFVKNLAEI